MANRLTGEAKYQALQEIEGKREEVERDGNNFLRRQGWEYSSDYPGSFWLWSKRLPGGRLVCVNQSTALNIEENLD
jgi:hypothetical protein